MVSNGLFPVLSATPQLKRRKGTTAIFGAIVTAVIAATCSRLLEQLTLTCRKMHTQCPSAPLVAEVSAVSGAWAFDAELS